MINHVFRNAPATAQKKDNDSLPVPEEAAKSLAQVSKTHQVLILHDINHHIVAFYIFTL